MNLFKSRGKFEYALLEYIEGTGEQYIYTGLRMSSNMYVESDLMYTSGTENVLIYARDSNTTTSICAFAYMQNSKFRIQFYNKGTEIIDSTYRSLNLNQKYNYKIQLKSGDSFWKLDDVTIASSTKSLSSYSNGSAIYVLHLGWGSGTSPGRIYNLKISQGGSLIRDLVPAKRLKDGVVGLYDKVNDKLYTNNGSGEFIQGKVIGRF